jgi:hypothetical protein
MISKILITFCSTVLVGAIALTVLKLTNNGPATLAKEAGGVELKVLQLPEDRGSIPVAIVGEKISVNPANGETEAVFAVKNNTGKNIDAITVAVTTRVENNTGQYSPTGYITRNSLIHPDIRDMHHESPLTPGNEWSLGTQPFETEAGDVLRGVTLQIDYVDFEDKTELGPNKIGSEVVTKFRSGAAKYKAWLVGKYEENGMSVNAVLPLLDRGQALPAELDLVDHERSGARLYRDHLLKAYRRHGIGEVEKYLNRES